MNDFESKVTTILDLIREHGIRSMGGSNIDFDEGTRRLFIQKVHEGFGLAQEMIIDELLAVNSQKSRNQREISDARAAKDKELIKKLTVKHKILNRNEFILRKLADSIAWQLLGMAHWRVRRFITENKVFPLKSSNLEFGRSFVQHHNEANPESFALLTDITSFIHVGDVLILDRTGGQSKISIVELKEGKANEEIMDFLSFFHESKCERALYFFMKEKGEKYTKQMMRIVKQEMKMNRLVNLIKTGEGKDVTGDYDVKIPDGYLELYNYDDRVRLLFILITFINSCQRASRRMECRLHGNM